MNTNSQRNSNIELLRCILMVQIVFYHLLVHGINGTFFQFFDWQPLPTTRIETFFLLLCMYPVDCFIIISGYYGIEIVKGEEIKFSRLLKTYLPLFFYSVLFATIALLRNKIGIKDFAYSFLPVMQSNYWFASCYIILVVLSPILNVIFEQFYKKKPFIIGFIILGFINFILTNTKFSELMGFGANRLFMVIYCYFVGRFLKAYENKLSLEKKQLKKFFVLITSFVVEYSLVIILQIVLKKNFWSHLSLNSSPFTILQAILVFSIFKGFPIYYNKLINLMGGGSFAIYLITENAYVRKPLYTIINYVGGGYKGKAILIPYLIACALVVSVLCLVIDLIRNMMPIFFQKKNKGKITK